MEKLGPVVGPGTSGPVKIISVMQSILLEMTLKSIKGEISILPLDTIESQSGMEIGKTYLKSFC